MNLELLSKEEQEELDCGWIAYFLAIGAGCTAELAIHKVEKTTGEFIYYATH